ncbi:MAG TPA: MYG1 family protein, partial [Vampirovibrionales bacterium]
MQKIVTHSGTFHADEVFACALLKLIYNEIEIIRTRDENLINAAQDDENIFVIDVGQKLEPSFKNFDHHQDANLPSSAGLLWEHYAAKWIKNNEATEIIRKNFIEGIDAIDINKDNILGLLYELPFNIKTVS